MVQRFTWKKSPFSEYQNRIVFCSFLWYRKPSNQPTLQCNLKAPVLHIHWQQIFKIINNLRSKRVILQRFFLGGGGGSPFFIDAVDSLFSTLENTPSTCILKLWWCFLTLILFFSKLNGKHFAPQACYSAKIISATVSNYIKLKFANIISLTLEYIFSIQSSHIKGEWNSLNMTTTTQFS